ncbi:MAG: CatB-related O-acetyltransferase [Muribaculaceae bacterium]|nr:CatB-related O-acetyltransferase [Muribaculaceae bacterium]
MGYGSYMGPYCRLTADIGRFTSIGPGVITSPFLHPYKAPYATTSPMFFSTRRQNGYTFAKRQTFGETNYADPARSIAIRIGNDCWIGEQAFIVGGVSIGDGAMVMARAVVTKDVPPYAIVGGVPARVVGYRFDPGTIEWLERTAWWNRPLQWLAQNWEAFNDIDTLKRILK